MKRSRLIQRVSGLCLSSHAHYRAQSWRTFWAGSPMSSLSLSWKYFSCVQFFATPWTVGHQAPLSMGFSRQEFWSELPLPPPEDIPNPGIEATSPMSAALVGGFFTTSTIWKAHKVWLNSCKTNLPMMPKLLYTSFFSGFLWTNHIECTLQQ